jgi:alpha-N-arabinofuranosidase
MSSDSAVAVRQYAFGGQRDVTNEALGRNCAHPASGVPSDGSANQVFEMLYPPVQPSSVRIRVAGTLWRRVDDLATAGPTDQAYELKPADGRVLFGDGRHGAVPPTGSSMRASYRSIHAGYFAFAKQMKAVDPDIKVCASWGTPEFPKVVSDRRFDCLTAHAITSFAAAGDDDWAGPLEGHDRLMLATAKRRDKVADVLHAMPEIAALAHRSQHHQR